MMGFAERATVTGIKPQIGPLSHAGDVIDLGCGLTAARLRTPRIGEQELEPKLEPSLVVSTLLA